MRSHRRRLPLGHTLIAGDVADLPGIVTAMAWLPAETYGQVLIEAGPYDEIPPISTPPRVTVHRIERTIDGLGVAVGRAVSAWVGEWIPDEPDERRTVTIWVGERVELSCPEVVGLAERL